MDSLNEHVGETLTNKSVGERLEIDWLSSDNTIMFLQNVLKKWHFARFAYPLGLETYLKCTSTSAKSLKVLLQSWHNFRSKCPIVAECSNQYELMLLGTISATSEPLHLWPIRATSAGHSQGALCSKPCQWHMPHMSEHWEVCPCEAMPWGTAANFFQYIPISITKLSFRAFFLSSTALALRHTEMPTNLT